MRRLLRTVVLGLGLLMQPCLYAAPATGTVHATDIDGVSYVKVPEMWRKYGLKPMKSTGKARSYTTKDNLQVTLIPGKQDFYVRTFHYVLSYPIRERDGELYVSTIDIEKLVDPVLSPRYSGRQVTTVVLDPGHGGHDSGAVSAYAREKVCNLQLALRVKRKLEKEGFKVVMTRKDDYFLTLQQRVAIANATPNCVFVSIHHNSGRSAAHGIETFTLAPHGTTSPFARTRRTEDLAGNKQDGENIALATAVHSRAIQATKAVDRGIQRARFSVLCTIKRPAILFEAGFVTNPQEGQLITRPEYQDKLANCITGGILAFRNTICTKGGSLRQRSTSGSGTIRSTNDLNNRYYKGSPLR